MVKNRSYFALLVLLPLIFLSFSPVKKFIRRAESQVARGNLEAATRLYKKALEIDPENIRANYGYGMMLCELLENYQKALPHLEMANRPPIEDSLYDLMFALGKCYQHNGEFQKAINYFDRLQYVVDLEEETDFQKDINKRKNDCRYALAHKDEPPSENIHVVNGGRTINTMYPEYVPVLLPGNKMLFTSKRQDDPRERVNYLDGKYFESMYLTEITPHGFRNTQRYTIPDGYGGKKGKWNRHESVISLSQDGSKLFTFRKGNIYEINLNETSSKEPRKLSVLMNRNVYENHAFLTKDGKNLYFSMEAESSLGGTDIYLSSRGEDGQWTAPANIGAPVNTPFDEDAPFLSEDGNTLYFASTGHPGYGNFDIYRTEKLASGYWDTPVNLGKPLNSPGHDIFLVNDSIQKTGYFSSGRNGGFGDMDIYKVLYLDKIDTACAEEFTHLFSLEISDADSTDYSNVVTLNMPANYRLLSYEWHLGGENVKGDTTRFEYDYKAPGTYLISSKIVALCDTCLSPVVACNTVENRIEKTEAVPDPTAAIAVDLENIEGELSDEQLRKLGFNTEPVLFGFDKATVSPSFKKMLDSNIVVLKRHDQLRIRVVGYTDSRGPAAYNKRLSERRARAVLDYLLKNGVSESQVAEVKGKGETELLNDCDGTKPCREAQHKKNRRVRVIVTAEKLRQ